MNTPRGIIQRTLASSELNQWAARYKIRDMTDAVLAALAAEGLTVCRETQRSLADVEMVLGNDGYYARLFVPVLEHTPEEKP